jgi:hypothetical protein
MRRTRPLRQRSAQDEAGHEQTPANLSLSHSLNDRILGPVPEVAFGGVVLVIQATAVTANGSPNFCWT